VRTIAVAQHKKARAVELLPAVMISGQWPAALYWSITLAGMRPRAGTTTPFDSAHFLTAAGS
jgi:hypothetical protein